MSNWLKNLFSPPEKTAPWDNSRDPGKKPPVQPARAEESVTHKEQGDAHLGKGNLEEAKACYRHAIALNPDYAKAYSNLGFVLNEQGLHEEAEHCLKTALSIDPKIADAHYMLGTIFQLQGKREDAISHFRKALEIEPDSEIIYRDLCYALFQHGKIEDAKQVIGKGIAINPGLPDFHYYLGNLHKHTGELDKAAACYRTALSIQPAYVEVHYNLGLVLQELGNLGEAIDSYRKAVSLKPDFAEAHYNMGVAFFKDQGRLPESEASFRRALEINPDYAEAHYNLGNTLKNRGRLTEAETSYRRALGIKPDYAEAHLNLGNILKERGLLAEAEASYRQALQVKPDYVEAHSNLGAILLDQGRMPETEDAYRNVLLHKPEHGHAMGQLFHVRRHLCEWRTVHEDDTRLLAFFEQNQPADISPFVLLANPSFNAQSQQLAAKLYAGHHYKAQIESKPYSSGIRTAHKRLRIGYLSADFHAHATMHLLAGVLEYHDSQSFTIYLYSYGPDIKDAGKTRIEAACDFFSDVRELSDELISKQILADEIDILVDMKGYTKDTRSGITAYRPAPIIISWLGYPGTLGHPRLADYIIGDSVVTPLEHAGHFSETLALMPHCYQPNDRERAIGACPSRYDAGLPETGFVFCSLNQSYKITPEMFTLWCRLLAAVPGSVLWLLESHPVAQTNLRCEAKARDIDPGRLVFAAKREQTGHLGRLQLADLALDTYPVTSHTTASDALWAGVPLITRMGETFASRVAASILQTMGFPELVTTSNENYFSLALDLAQDTSRLADIKQTLATRRLTSPLFDTERFTRDLERLYRAIWDQEVAGERKPVVLAAKNNASINPSVNE